MASLGAILDEQPREGDTPKMKGSVLVAVAESRQEVLKLVKEDVYSTHGVWNVEKVQIYPVSVKSSVWRVSYNTELIVVQFRTAIRQPLLAVE